MDFGGISTIVLPVFALIGIGYGVATFKLLPEHVGDAVGDFVFVIATPALIFRTLATANFAGPSPWLLWMTYFVSAVIIWFLGDAIVRYGFKRDARAGMIGGVSSAFANTVLVGIPVVFAAYGEAGAVPFLLIVSIHMPFMMILSTVLIDRAEIADGVKQGGASIKQLAQRVADNLIRNPIILAVAASFLFRQTGLPLSGLPATIIERLADTAVPCALFSLGMSLKRYGIRGNLPPALALSFLKLAVFPALVWVIAEKVAGLPPLWTAAAVISSACPTGVNAYLIANRFHTGHALAANTITLTTAFGVVSVGFWLTFLQTFGS